MNLSCKKPLPPLPDLYIPELRVPAGEDTRKKLTFGDCRDSLLEEWFSGSRCLPVCVPPEYLEQFEWSVFSFASCGEHHVRMFTCLTLPCLQ